MTDLTPALVEQRLNWRYACKRFDPGRRISDETWAALERGLVLTPSSFGLQPWRFIVITDKSVKDQLPPLSWHQTQPRDCSHMVVLAARKSLDADYVDRFIDSVAAGRNVPKESLSGYHHVILQSVEKSAGRQLDWNARQVYIALGQLMTAAAMLEVDSCPMEGIDLAGYDKLLGLSDSDYTTVVACALGYRHIEDKYSTARKIRFADSDLIERV